MTGIFRTFRSVLFMSSCDRTNSDNLNLARITRRSRCQASPQPHPPRISKAPGQPLHPKEPVSPWLTQALPRRENCLGVKSPKDCSPGPRVDLEKGCSPRRSHPWKMRQKLPLPQTPRSRRREDAAHMGKSWLACWTPLQRPPTPGLRSVGRIITDLHRLQGTSLGMPTSPFLPDHQADVS